MLVLVRRARAGRVEPNRIHVTLRETDGVRFHEQEFGVGVDESLDEPVGGCAIDPDLPARHPSPAHFLRNDAQSFGRSATGLAPDSLAASAYSSSNSIEPRCNRAASSA